MACCAILLSERGRQCLGSKLLLLNMAIAVMGLILFGAGAVLRFLFHQQRDLIKEYNYKYITNIIIGVGSSMFLFHILGAKVCFDCSSYKTRYAFKGILFIELALSFVVMGAMSYMSFTCQKTIHSATKGFVTGFRVLMSNYSTDESKRLEIDLIQIKHQCCGGVNYTDWLSIEWYENRFLRPEVPNLQQLLKKAPPYRKKKLSQVKKISPRGVPFTCCDPHKMGPCIHDIVLFPKSGFIRDKGGSRFYQKGCGEVLMGNIKWLLSAISLWVLIPFWIELLSIIFVKYLYSSICNAEDNEQEKGPGYGYLMEESPIKICNCCNCDINQLAKNIKKEDEWTAANKRLREMEMEKFRQAKREKKKQKREQELMQSTGWTFKGNKKDKKGKSEGQRKPQK